MEKVIRNGKVAVLYSPNYGAGWYSWHNKKELLFHPEIVKLVEEGRRDEITEELCRRVLGVDDSVYIGVLGADGLRIEWLDEGSAFRITEYDGAESIEVAPFNDLITA